MIKLRLIGPSSDLESVVLSSKPRGKRGSHLLKVDDRLLKSLEELLIQRRKRKVDEERQAARPGGPREMPRIPPREIQRLLRAGRSPQQVAQVAGVDLQYVEQFSTPVLYERAGIIRDVQGAVLEKQRKGVSGAPLGEAVARNLRQRRVKMSAEEFQRRWDATRADGQPWSVSFTFVFRGRERRAVWRFEPQRRRLQAANAVAADVGWVPDGRGKREVRYQMPVVVEKGRARAKPRRAKAKRSAKPKPRRPATKRAAARPARSAAPRASGRRAPKRAVRARTGRTPARRARRR